jgi:predicted ATPase/DNA-binding CsgD family transcriptional regulator
MLHSIEEISMPGLAAHPQSATTLLALVGRDGALAAAETIFHHPDARLLTVTGPAGVGKTRFAAELLRIHGAPADRDVVAVELAALGSPGDLDAEFARAAGIAPAPGDTVAAAVRRWLAARETLVLLDNAEHLLGIGPRVAEWLAAAPGLRVVVTSRQRLNLSIETELELQPLETRPEAAGVQPLSPAAELFARMAGCDAPGRLPSDTIDALERLAARLEGLPLALDLVAARLPALDPARLAALVDSTDAITRSLPDVASALDVAVARSYALLSPPARQLLRALTVFRGGFSVELVERFIACAPGLGIDPAAAPDLLDEMSEHHLILLQEHPRRGPRFAMLAMVAEAVGRHLRERGEEEIARQAHARAVIGYAEAREYAGFWPGHEHEVAELSADFHNIMAAIAWLHDHDAVDDLVRLVGALTWFWYSQGHYAHGLWQFERVRALDPPRHGRDWARFELGYGVILDLVARFEDARAVMREGLAAYQAINSADGAAAASIALGFNAFHLGHHDDAQASLDRAIRHARAIPDEDLGRALEAVALANIGANAHEQGDTVTAEISLRRAVEIHEDMRLQWGVARGLCDLGGVLRDAGKLDDALDVYQRALVPATALGDHRLIAVALAGIGAVLVRDGQPRLGTWLFGGVAALRPIAGQPSFLRTNEIAWSRARDTAREALGDRAFALARAAGTAASVDTLVATARRATRLGPDPFPPARQPLTSQERSVLRMILQDITTKMMSDLLGISERTVNSHLSSLFRKYGVNSRLEILALASHRRGQRPTDASPGIRL